MPPRSRLDRRQRGKVSAGSVEPASGFHHPIGIVQFTGLLGRHPHLLWIGARAGNLVRVMPAEQAPVGSLDAQRIGVRPYSQQRHRTFVVVAAADRRALHGVVVSRQRLDLRPCPAKPHAPYPDQLAFDPRSLAVRPGHPPAGAQHILGNVRLPLQATQVTAQAIGAVAAALEGVDGAQLIRLVQVQTAHLDTCLMDMAGQNPSVTFGQTAQQHKQQIVLVDRCTSAQTLTQMRPTLQFQAPVQRLAQQSTEHCAWNTGNCVTDSSADQCAGPKHSASLRKHLLDFSQALVGADIDPAPSVVLARDQPLMHRLAQQRRELERAGLAIGKQLWMEDGDTAVGQPLPRRIVVAHLTVDQREVARRVMRGVIDQHQVRKAFKRHAQCAEVVIGPDIPVDHHEGLKAKQRQCALNATARFKRHAFWGVTDAQVETLTVAQVILDLLAQPRMVDDQLVKPCIAQGVQVVFDQRYIPDTHQRFGRMQGQRAHSLAFTGSENHRFHAVLFDTIKIFSKMAIFQSGPL
ncbi:hypothetical protein ALP21_05424 [Pseudomonas savastanoi pv. phaseolicola]|uniref:Uncharacterized protein n=1 Tax=Pseudomonas savastanoi pv. phaseolicola TaxID=319 RepID=A0A7Z6Y5L9_PSESH|nr:hypothetical protein ALP21_05424 [Pseudomonas savastanoi pv. phaseolicola]